jgi:hypothetical protein
MLQPIVAINTAINKPMIIAELGIGVRRSGSGSFTDAQKNVFLTDTLSMLGQPDLGTRVEAITFFYTNKDDADWTLDAWPTTLDTLATAALASPRMIGSAPPPA